jgi:hypothetical protein
MAQLMHFVERSTPAHSNLIVLVTRAPPRFAADRPFPDRPGRKGVCRTETLGIVETDVRWGDVRIVQRHNVVASEDRAGRSGRMSRAGP